VLSIVQIICIILAPSVVLSWELIPSLHAHREYVGPIPVPIPTHVRVSERSEGRALQAFDMALLSLPAELLLEVSVHIHSENDLNALVQVKSWFDQTLYQNLYRFDQEYCGSSALN
jgi:hypothetical protein